MDLQDAQIRFTSLLTAIGNGEHTPIEGQDRYPEDIGHFLTDETKIAKYWHYQMSHLRQVRHHLEGRTLLDAGCGAGSLSVLLSLLGAEKVLAVDLLERQVEQARFLVRAAGLDNIEVIQGDVATLELPPQSIDGVLSIEAISHYSGHDTFLDTMSTILRPGGFVLISDGNNAVSRQVRAMTREVWDAFENSPEPVAVHGHTLKGPCYRSMRESIIRDAFPEIDEQTARLYAGYTSGYTRERVIEAVRQFQEGDYSPRSEWSPEKCPLNPLTDALMERLVHPHELARDLTRRGFRCNIKSNGPVNPKLLALRWAWEALSPLTIYMPRGFSVAAFKSGG